MTGAPVSRRNVLAIASLGTLGASLSACSTSEAGSATTPSAGTGDTTYAQSIVDKYANAAITWSGPTEPVAMAKGKKVVVVALTMTSVSNQRVSAGIQEAAELGGWDVTIIDGGGLPEDFGAGIDTAIAQQADAIVLMGSQQVPEALTRAGDAGIPVVGCIDTTNNPLFENSAYAHMVAERGEDLGAAAAAQLVLDVGAGTPVGTFAAAPGDPLGDLLLAGGQDVLDKSGCNAVAALTLEFSELGTGSIGQKAVAAVQANPEIVAFWVSWDGAAGEVVTAFLNAGVDVPVYSTYADPQNVEFMKEDTIQKADVAVALEWDGWAVVDNLNRIFAGTPAARDADDGVPIKLVNSENLSTVFPGEETAWEGEFDFRAKYSELWGAS